MGSLVRWLSTVVASAAAFVLFGALMSGLIVEATADAGPVTSSRDSWYVYGQIDPIPAGTISALAALPVGASIPPVAAPAATDAPAIAVAPTVQPDLWRVTTGVNMRERSSKQSGLLGTLRAGTEVTVVARERNWLFVRTAEGRQGWVYGTFLEPAGRAAVAATR